MNKASVADFAHLQDEFDSLRGSTRRQSRRTSLIGRRSFNADAEEGGGEDVRKALRDQQKLIQQVTALSIFNSQTIPFKFKVCR